MSKPKKITLLFCMNDRGQSRRSCASAGADALCLHAKEQFASYPEARIKIKKTDCLGDCKHGPIVQLLPADRLLRNVTEADIDRLFARQLK